jgi:Family of unknown function (DUF5989)
MMKPNQNRVDVVDAYLGVPIEILRFLWARKLWWLVPVVICLLVIGGLLLLAASSPVAPFIYPLF